MTTTNPKKAPPPALTPLTFSIRAPFHCSTRTRLDRDVQWRWRSKKSTNSLRTATGPRERCLSPGWPETRFCHRFRPPRPPRPPLPLPQKWRMRAVMISAGNSGSIQESVEKKSSVGGGGGRRGGCGLWGSEKFAMGFGKYVYHSHDLNLSRYVFLVLHITHNSRQMDPPSYIHM